MDYPQTLTKRLRPLFIAAFLQSFVFWYAIEKPFLNHLGLDKEAMALVSIVFSVSYLIINVPSGILADRWSRRGVLMLGSLCLAFACFIAGNSRGILTYAASMVIFAAYIASTQ